MTAAPSFGLPDGVLVGFYGDDFTGSTAVMEVLSFAGLPTALFLTAPTAEQLARFDGYRAIGIAGVARSQTRSWMSERLPAVFRSLAALRAPIAQYKVCSTFDSAPHVGSIGHAVDLAAPILGGAWHPMVIGAPAIGRYQAFGNLFAAAAGDHHRLDHHPTMSRHPVTPMDDSDLGRHLAKQTERPVGLVDLVAMKRGEADQRLACEREAGAEIVSLDVIDDETLAEAGRLVWENRGQRLFCIGSQGLEYALVAHWRQAGLLGEALPGSFKATPVERIAVVSGSCSPATAAQIAHAEQNGFAPIRLDAARTVDEKAWTAEVGRAADAALKALGDGRGPLVFTASGPDDPALAHMAAAIAASGVSANLANDRIGDGLGRLLGRVMRDGGLTRAAVAGGDTSGHAALALGIHALTALAPVAPGAPLCRAHFDDPAHPACEIALKGGQMGAPDFFDAVRLGGKKA